MKTSQPVRDGLRAKIDRFPKETIESPIFGDYSMSNIVASHRIAHFWAISAQKG
jgi:hypothetical protein